MIMKKKLQTTVNGKFYELLVEPNKLLVEVLRDELGLTGTKFACSTGSCCSCTVLLEGRAVKSCSVLAMQVQGKNLTTIEGLAEGDKLHPLQESFVRNHGFACGFCTPGMAMAVKGLLEENYNPTDQEVRGAIEGHICRCGTYPNIVKSALEAAKEMREGKR